MATIPITWSVQVDWTGTGVWVEEAARTVRLALERGSENRFDSLPAGKLMLTFDNQDRRFDPWYSSSPLYPYVQPHKQVRVRATYAGTEYPLFVGRIEDIEPTGGMGHRRVTLTAYDGLRQLGIADASLALQSGIDLDQAVDLALTDAGWPTGSGYRDLDPSMESLSFWWRDHRQKVYDEIFDLTVSEHGAFFVTSDGKARLISRATLTTGNTLATLDEDVLTDVSVVNPWEAVINDAEVVCQPALQGALSTIWKLADTEIYLAAGASAVVYAEYAVSGQRGAATGVQDPVATTDYTANSLSDGSGVDQTANLTVTIVKYATYAKLTFSNTGSAALYITKCELHGYPIEQYPVLVWSEDAPSKATYGTRRLSVSTPWQQRVQAARDLATGLVNNFKSPATPVTVTLQRRLPEMLTYELFDRMTITVPTYSIARDMQVAKLTYSTGSTMQDLRLEMHLVPAETQVAWILGVVNKSELGKTTWLGY